MPQGANPATRSRFDMILSVKEHEMHHRGQLMLIERILGIVPHLTRRCRNATRHPRRRNSRGARPAGPGFISGAERRTGSPKKSGEPALFPCGTIRIFCSGR